MCVAISLNVKNTQKFSNEVRKELSNEKGTLYIRKNKIEAFKKSNETISKFNKRKPAFLVLIVCVSLCMWLSLMMIWKIIQVFFFSICEYLAQ